MNVVYLMVFPAGWDYVQTVLGSSCNLATNPVGWALSAGVRCGQRGVPGFGWKAAGWAGDLAAGLLLLEGDNGNISRGDA